MISTRKRPLILGGMLLPAVAGPTRLSGAKEGTPATPASPSPPAQPATGPGDADYAYDEVVASAWYGQDPYARAYRTGYWLFEPAVPRDGAPPVDAPLPLDTHGSPALMASQHVPVAMFELLDALDWYGTWKVLDGLMGCAFAGEWCEYAFGDTPEVRSMGTWSDGVPVTEALVVPDPAAPEATPAG